MNIRITWVLAAVLLASIAVLFYPDRERQFVDLGSTLAPQGESERLTILVAKVRAFDRQGAPSWTLESPEIAYFHDGSLEISAPRLHLHSQSGSQIQAEAGEGALTPGGFEESLELRSDVSARIFSAGNELNLSTQKLTIAQDGKQITAPLPIRLNSVSGETTAARLDLNLEEQILLLGSTPELRVTTRLYPGSVSR